MMEKYEKIFEQVMEEKNIKDWYELYDGEDFEEVEKLCQELEDYDEEIFGKWVLRLYWDL